MTNRQAFKLKNTLTLAIVILVSCTQSPKQSSAQYDQRAAEEYSANDVQAFLYSWFAGFDHQREVDFFLKHIAEPVDMHFPDFPVRSKEDFRRWYKNVEDIISWNSHAIRNLQVTGNETDGWHASYDVEWKARDKNNKSIAMLIHQEVQLMRQGDILQITQHKAYARDLNHQDTHLSELMKAAGNGDAKRVKDLINKGANIYTLDALTGTSVVHFAAQGGNTEVMKVLIENGAEAIINLQAASNSFTPLMVATWYQNPDMIKYLLSLEHINPNLKDQFGRTAQQFPVVAKGYTALHPIDQQIVDIFNDYYEQREKMIANKFMADRMTPKNLPEDVDLRIPNVETGNSQHTAALVAARDNDLMLFKKMLENGADLTAAGEYMKAIAAHKAAYMGNPEIMTLIVQHPDFDKIKNAQGPTNGYTPLHDAIWHGHTATAKILIDAGVDTSLKGWDGLTPLDLAKKLNYNEIVQLLQQ
ncbi:ankyrin repeat domain-containing protein [Carboxylicivirga sp. RSCT41]|uniref:ankyrin repeat domain-containing protein n=1 Tax=Carboxylicivirga agarovorans TaxID=3417570 RepID=UPI003D32AE9F